MALWLDSGHFSFLVHEGVGAAHCRPPWYYPCLVSLHLAQIFANSPSPNTPQSPALSLADTPGPFSYCGISHILSVALSTWTPLCSKARGRLPVGAMEGPDKVLVPKWTPFHST